MKKVLHLLILIIFNFQLLTVSAQTSEIDSLENILQQYTKKDTVRVNLLNEIAYKIYLRDFEKTLIYATKANKLAEKLNFQKGRAVSFRYIGIHYYMKANYLKALEYYQKSLKIEEKLNNIKGIARCCNNIGMIYMYQNNFPKSLKYLQKALTKSDESNDKLGTSLTLNNIGNTYRSMTEYSKALEYYQKALILKKDLGNKRGIAGTLHNIGKNYKFQANYTKAFEYLKKSLKISIEIGDKSVEARNYTELGSVYLKQKKIKEAYDYSKKAFTLAKEIGELNFQKESLKILAKSCETLGLYKEAYNYQVFFKAVNDSIYNKESDKKIAGLEYKYKYEKEKDAAKLEQQKKDTLRAEYNKRQRIVSIFLFLCFMLMLLLFVIVYKSFLQKQKANKILAEQKNIIEEKNNELFQQNHEIKAQSEEMSTNNTKLNELNATKDKFFSIIAHDLKSPFNAILGFSEILFNNHKNYDHKKLEEMINIVNNSAIRAYKLLENLLTWSRSHSGNIPYIPKELYLKTLLIETLYNQEGQANKKNIKVTETIHENELIFADENMIATVLRNLISNAIKFTPKNGNIVISSKKRANSNFLEISVTDTGIGIPKDKIDHIFSIDMDTSTQGTERETGTGLGLILCKEFVEKHGGKIWVESEEGEGSEFIFSILNIGNKN